MSLSTTYNPNSNPLPFFDHNLKQSSINPQTHHQRPLGETARRERRGTRFELLVQANPKIKRGSERDVEGDFERERERERDERRES